MILPQRRRATATPPVPHPFPGRHFGKLYPKFSRKILHFADYATSALPMPPPRADWTKGFDINFGMMLNDRLGCCVEAAKGHAIQTLSLDNGRMQTTADSVVLAAYEANGGYVPGNAATDNGENEVDSLTAWQAAGTAGFGGFELDAFAGLRLSLPDHIHQAIWLLGGVYIGFQVPQSAMDQNAAGATWDVVANDGGIVGGHAVWVPAYDAAAATLTAITWGMRQRMTWAFWMKYVDEGYALKSPTWLGNRPAAPSGFKATDWDADVAAIAAARGMGRAA